MSLEERHRRRLLARGLALLSLIGLLAGLLIGSEGASFSALQALFDDGSAGLVLGQIRLPRTLGAWLTGALFGLAGAIAQGLFRNPLADPYLLGSAAGASLGVVLVLTAGSAVLGGGAAGWLARFGLVGAAFCGALLGVSLTLMLARGATHTTRLLLAGIERDIELNLADRGLMLLPMLLGRSAMQGAFMVDPSRSWLHNRKRLQPAPTSFP